jgi:hypothetical protein
MTFLFLATAGWHEMFFAGERQLYYWHSAKGVTQWDRPDGPIVAATTKWGIGWNAAGQFPEYIERATGNKSTTKPIDYDFMDVNDYWTRGMSQEYNHEYFYNSLTDETTWIKPSSMA